MAKDMEKLIQEEAELEIKQKELELRKKRKILEEEEIRLDEKDYEEKNPKSASEKWNEAEQKFIDSPLGKICGFLIYCGLFGVLMVTIPQYIKNPQIFPRGESINFCSASFHFSEADLGFFSS
jgi:hypothetical protein